MKFKEHWNREAVMAELAKMLAEDPPPTNTFMAHRVGVSKHTVARYIAAIRGEDLEMREPPRYPIWEANERGIRVCVGYTTRWVPDGAE